MELICADGLIDGGIIDELAAIFNKMEYPDKVCFKQKNIIFNPALYKNNKF